MRISDWSSDVCSSDLHIAERRAQLRVRSRSLLREQQFMQVELRQPVDAQVVLRLPERRDLQDRGPAEPAMRQQQAGAKRCAVTARLDRPCDAGQVRSEEHTSDLQSPMRNSYDVFVLQ